MSVINVTVSGTTNQTTLVDGGQVYNVTFADQSGGDGISAAATIAVGSVATVSATESASVVNSGTAYAAKLDFKIPRGAPAGLSIGTVTGGTVAAASITGSAPSQVLSLTLPAGPQGPPNSLSIGTVAGGTAAAATITGSAPSQVLSLTLPVGQTGPQGETGPATSLSIGTVTGGTAAAATITGSAPSQTLSLTLPQGAKGDPGPYTTIVVGKVTTGAPGTNAAITTTKNGDTATLDFTIPAGAPGSVNLSDETPQPLGAASAGTAEAAARADHVHAVPTISYTNLTNVPTTFTPAIHNQAISTITGLEAALAGKQAAGDYATLDGSGRVPSSQLPSYVDDVIEYTNLAGFPATGEVGKLYVDRSTNKVYRWSGSTYVEISASPGSTDAVPEGSVNLYHTTQRAAAAAPVQSVAGQTGTITLTQSDVGLGSVPNVDATARANHTGTQTASTISDFATEAAKYGPVTSVNGQTGAVTVSGGGGGGGAASVSYDYATTSALPATGDAGLLYCTTDNGQLWRWTGSVYAEVGPLGGGGEDLVLRSYFAPPAPTGVTAVGGNAQASVTWTAPAVLSVLPITDYVVQYSSNSGSTWTTFSDGTSTATSATVPELTNGTAYTFRVAGVNAIGQGEYSTASGSVTPAVGDQYFANVSLLIHGDGSGSNFVDLSGSPKTITAYGNATQSSDQSKWGGKSIYLDGSGDYLTIPVSSAFEFGTSDFSIEFWARLSSGNNWQRVIGLGQGANAAGPYTAWSVALSGNYVRFYRFDDNEYLYDANVQLSQAQWYHIAVTRASGVLKIFVDGTEVGSWSGVNGVSLNRRNEDPVYIGRVIGGMGDAYFSGYIDDLRVTKGVARTITVPIGPYPDS
jgi:hypothetical protein